MATRATLDLELAPLLKAVRNRLDAMRDVSVETKNGLEIHSRSGLPFLQLELKRDHMHLDLWLAPAAAEDAKASGLARTHAFFPDAVRVRFERASDLSRVCRWLEESYRNVPARAALRAAPAPTPDGEG